MAPQVWNDFVTLVCAHPVITATILLFFTPPFFPIVKFFSPLLISTAVFMLALFTMGPKKNESGEEEEEWTVEREGDGTKVGQRVKPESSWKDWMKGIEESGITWMSSPRSASKAAKNWKNDETVSILEEASWVKRSDFMGSEFGDGDGDGGGQASGSFMPNLMAPSQLFKVDSGLQSHAERSIFSDMGLDEDAPELEDFEEPVREPVAEPVREPVGKPVREPVAEPVREPIAEPVREPVAESLGEPTERPSTETDQPSGPPVESSAGVPNHAVQHQPMDTLRIPSRSESGITDSPSTDLDDGSPDVGLNNSRRLLFARLKKSSLKSDSGLSDTDTPEAVNLSLSGKLKQMESLGDLLHVAEEAERAGLDLPEDSVLLKPTTAEEVDDVKDQLASFVTENGTAASQTAKKSTVAPVPAKAATEAQKTGPMKNPIANGNGLSDNNPEMGSFPASARPR